MVQFEILYWRISHHILKSGIVRTYEIDWNWEFFAQGKRFLVSVICSMLHGDRELLVGI